MKPKKIYKTKNPRISFVPSDQVAALVARIADVSGQSRASICAEILNDVAPVMQEQLGALEKLRDVPEKAREHLENLAAASRQDIDQALLELPAVDHRRKHHKDRDRRVSGT
jgi:hypothetical protein